MQSAIVHTRRTQSTLNQWFFDASFFARLSVLFVSLLANGVSHLTGTRGCDSASTITVCVACMQTSTQSRAHIFIRIKTMKEKVGFNGGWKRPFEWYLRAGILCLCKFCGRGHVCLLTLLLSDSGSSSGMCHVRWRYVACEERACMCLWPTYSSSRPSQQP